MTKNEFKCLAESRLLFLDGATGSNLMKKGMPAGVCPEQWIIDHPEAILELQRAYVAAGSQILYAPTFTGSRIKLEEYGLADRISEINTRLVQLSKQAANGKALVAGDISMTGKQLRPVGNFELETLIAIYKEQIFYLAKAGADLLVVETMMSLQEARAALIAARETCDLPVMVSLTFEANGRTLFGTDGRTAAVVLESLGASAIGVNCSTGPDKMLSVIQAMAEVSDLPLIAKPNAGLPSLDSKGNTIYDMNEESFAFHMQNLIQAGVSILGGCCGTAPSYIAELVSKYSELKPAKRKMTSFRHLSSERSTLSFGLTDPFLIVGERINPTGKKKLQEELRNGKLDMVLQFAREQEECGAAVLDVNMGMSGVNETERMLQAIEELSMATSLPLAIDSSHVETIEKALRHYPGRALINSISFEKGKVEKLLPVAAKYGAMFILLPLSEKGLPENMEEKKEIMAAITERALQLGLKKEDIVVDGLVATVGANKNAALEALETIRYCKENGYATICGLSNISFGLPERSYINTAFLTMAIREGLTMAIANPSQELLINSALASDLLLNREEADIRYIDQMNRCKELAEKRGYSSVLPQSACPKSKQDQGKEMTDPKGTATQAAEETGDGKPAGMQVKEAVLKGNRAGITELTKAALEEGIEAGELLNEFLLPAINEVGALFDKGRYFLPQLISSAETMKLSVEYLEPLLMQDSREEKEATVVIATVEGDIHDIGKNLVVLMLKNYGFHVIDLGKDISRETIVEQAVENKAEVIALSALMTTTMVEMKKVIELVREKSIPVKVIIGGAVITQEYADEIGADGYAKDAADTIRVIRHLLDGV